MEIQTTKPFDKNWDTLPQGIKRRAKKQFDLLIKNPKHPSLRLKKMQGYSETWEGSITRKYRFTFQIEGDTYILRKVGKHEILRKP